MEVNGIKVYDLEESIIASGFPMDTGKLVNNFDEEVEDVNMYLMGFECENGQKHFERFIKLAQAKTGSGHNCALKGVLVSCNITADQSFWLQWSRYHFQDTISSQSKQHRLLRMDLSNVEGVEESVIYTLKEMIKVYISSDGAGVTWKDKVYIKEAFFEKIIKTCPVGLPLTARVTMNYLQLRSMYLQRRTHKMSDWRIDFVKFVDSLPYADKLIKF